MPDKPEYAIDLDKIIEARAGKGKIPGFAVNLIKKLFHVDFINNFLVRGYEGVDFCEEAIKYLGVDVQVQGMENLSPDGRYTFVSNHPLGGIDGITMGMLVGRKFDGKVRYLVNDFLMNIKGLAPICTPINIIGSQSKDLPRLIDEAFHSDNQMIVFPSGLCSRKTDGVIQDREWGKAFVRKSVETGRDVVPVHFIGRNSERFYRFATLCKKLKLKFNFAMLLLPDEMYKSRHREFVVKFGEPIPVETFDSSKTAFQWAQWVRAKAYEL